MRKAILLLAFSLIIVPVASASSGKHYSKHRKHYGHQSHGYSGGYSGHHRHYGHRAHGCKIKHYYRHHKSYGHLSHKKIKKYYRHENHHNKGRVYKNRGHGGYEDYGDYGSITIGHKGGGGFFKIKVGQKF